MAITKILENDLDIDLRKLLEDLKNSRGASSSLTQRLSDQDLLITALRSAIKEQAEECNFNESFSYDEYDNVVSHTVTGEINYRIVYTYDNPESGVITGSTKTYESAGASVEIAKTYSYEESSGNIVGIQTQTTVTPLNV